MGPLIWSSSRQRLQFELGHLEVTNQSELKLRTLKCCRIVFVNLSKGSFDMNG